MGGPVVLDGCGWWRDHGLEPWRSSGVVELVQARQCSHGPANPQALEQDIPGPMMCRALLRIRSNLSRWDLAAPTQASGTYSSNGRMKPLCAATRPWWSSTRAARCKKPRRRLARFETLWTWRWKARLESNVTPSSFRYSATAIAVPPNKMGENGDCWWALEMTWSWLLAGSKLNLTRHCLHQSCRLIIQGLL